MTTRELVNPVWSLFDAAVRHYNVRVICPRCAHSEVLHSAAMWKMFEGRNWDDDLRNVPARLYCSRCWQTYSTKSRPNATLVEVAETVPLPFPTDAEWKRAISRRR